MHIVNFQLFYKGYKYQGGIVNIYFWIQSYDEQLKELLIFLLFFYFIKYI